MVRRPIEGESMSDSNQQGSQENKRLRATENDPDLGVHVVTEYMFCERAGVIAHESKFKDNGQEIRPVRLGYIPRYDEREIEKKLGLVFMWLLWGVGASVLGIVVCGVLALTVWPLTVLGCWLLLLLTIAGVTYGLVITFQLTSRLSKARGAKPKEPTFNGAGEVPVDWWQLLAAGYEAQLWPDQLSLPEWKLHGSPWRVLVRGETYIPVFLWHSKKRKLHKQHFARMAAYCELLRIAAWGNSPYGVILFSGSTDGIAIPNTEVSRDALADGVRGMRQLLRLIATGPLFANPAKESFCFDCPYAYLKPYSEIPEREGDPKPTLVGTGKSKRHSTCGDRFRWTPPRQ